MKSLEIRLFIKHYNMKYYVEIFNIKSKNYILQSRFFESYFTALAWFDYITFLDEEHEAHLMEVEWDYQENTYRDIHFKKIIKLRK